MEKIDIFEKKDGYKTVKITTDDGSFEIAFENNLDLYWYYRPKDNTSKIKKFIITKENYYLYKTFDDLYNSIINFTPFEDSNYRYYNNYSSKCRELFIDNKINWHSDDIYYDYSSVLYIEKVNDEFVVEFEKSKGFDDDYFLSTFTIRFRNSGSRYEPFNVTFMNMYNKLLQYDNQIYLEEVIYNNEKKLIKTK